MAEKQDLNQEQFNEFLTYVAQEQKIKSAGELVSDTLTGKGPLMEILRQKNPLIKKYMTTGSIFINRLLLDKTDFNLSNDDKKLLIEVGAFGNLDPRSGFKLNTNDKKIAQIVENNAKDLAEKKETLSSTNYEVYRAKQRQKLVDDVLQAKVKNVVFDNEMPTLDFYSRDKSKPFSNFLQKELNMQSGYGFNPEIPEYAANIVGQEYIPASNQERFNIIPESKGEVYTTPERKIDRLESFIPDKESGYLSGPEGIYYNPETEQFLRQQPVYGPKQELQGYQYDPRLKDILSTAVGESYGSQFKQGGNTNMDIKQQTKNVAAQGRFGDSMLLHVNPAEVKGLASAMPITTNPETGQPEAFLPFLAPMLGSLIAPTILAGTGLSAAAMAGIGAGLGTYAQTGGSGSKALISGLTAGLGTKALEGVANPGLDTAIADAQVKAGIGTPVDPSFVGPMPTPAPTTLASQQAAEQAVRQTVGGPVSSLQKIFNPGLDEGIKSLGSAAMTPTGMLAGTTAGTGAVMQSQEEFERQMAQMQLDEEERKKRMYEMYPEQIPVASGGKTGYQRGGMSFYPTFDPMMNMNFNPVQNINSTTTRQTRQINPGFMAGFSPEYRYFRGDDPKRYLTRYAGNIEDSSNPQTFGFQPPVQPLSPRQFINEGRYMPPPRFGGYGNPFMQTPSYRSFYGNPQMGGMINPYARFRQQPIQPYFAPPPIYTPPPPPLPPKDDLPPPDIPPPDDNIGRKGTPRNITPIIPPDDFVTSGPVRGGMNREIPVPITTPPPTITIPIEGGADVKIPDFSKINTPITPPMIKGLEDRDAMRQEMSIDRGSMINENPVTFTPPIAPPSVTSPSITPPTPAAPANTPMQKPMSIGGPGGGRNNMFGRSMLFSEGEDTNKELPNEGLKALAKTEKGREAVEAMGYQEGGPTDMMQDPITQEVIQFILGETDNNEIINEFIIKYGQEQLIMLRDMILKQAAGNPDVQTEGLIEGVGNSGMADDLPMNIGNKPIAAVSQDEYIIPADVVSMLGDGSSDAGSKQLDGMLDRVRMAKTGGKTQAPPLNPEEVLPA